MLVTSFANSALAGMRWSLALPASTWAIAVRLNGCVTSVAHQGFCKGAGYLCRESPAESQSESLSAMTSMQVGYCEEAEFHDLFTMEQWERLRVTCVA
jgi:hypothetical protein